MKPNYSLTDLESKYHEIKRIMLMYKFIEPEIRLAHKSLTNIINQLSWAKSQLQSPKTPIHKKPRTIPSKTQLIKSTILKELRDYGDRETSALFAQLCFLHITTCSPKTKRRALDYNMFLSCLTVLKNDGLIIKSRPGRTSPWILTPKS
jgi:hypothetical protein